METRGHTSLCRIGVLDDKGRREMIVIAGGILLAFVVHGLLSMIPKWFDDLILWPLLATIGFFSVFLLSFTETGMSIAAQIGTDPDGHMVLGGIGAAGLVVWRAMAKISSPVRH